METLTQVLHTKDKAIIKSFRLIPNVIGIPKRYENCGFRNFILKDECRNAYEACKNIQQGECLTVTGNVGTGKTHLAIAALRNFPMIRNTEEEATKIKKNLEYEYEIELPGEFKDRLRDYIDKEVYKWRKAKCKFIPAPELFLELSETFGSEKSKSEILNEISSFDCICIDDLGAEKLSETNRQNFYLIIDRCYREMKSLLITSNMTIEEINNYEPRIASRLAEMGKIYFINTNDHRLI